MCKLEEYIEMALILLFCVMLGLDWYIPPLHSHLWGGVVAESSLSATDDMINFSTILFDILI